MLFDIFQLKRIRKQLGLTQTELAKASGVSQSLIAKIESRKIDPSYSIVKRIAEAIEKMQSEHEAEAKDIMVRKVVTVGPKERVINIVKLLNKYAISQVPVLNNDNVVGIVYESDILEKSVEKGLSGLVAEDVMSEAPPILSENTKISAISSLLKYSPVVLVAKKGKIIGLISKADVLKQLV